MIRRRGGDWLRKKACGVEAMISGDAMNDLLTIT